MEQNLWLALYLSIKEEKWDQTIDISKKLCDRFWGDTGVDPFFCELFDVELLKVFKEIELVRCKPGQIIMKEGELGDSMFIVVSGQVEVSQSTPASKGVVLPLPPVLINHLVSKLVQGHDIFLTKLGSGAIIGETALLLSKPRTATVKALKETELIKIKRSVFDKAVYKKPRLKTQLKELYIAHLERSNEKLKHAGDEVNACVTNMVYHRVKEAVVKKSIRDSDISDMETSKLGREFTEEDRTNLTVYLKAIENALNGGQAQKAISFYLKAGVLVLKNSINNVTRNVFSLLSHLKPFIDSAQEKLNIPILLSLSKAVSMHHANQKTQDIQSMNLSECNFLSFFDAKILQNIDKGCLIHFKKDETVIKAGDKSNEVYVINKGEAQVLTTWNEELAVLGEGAFFGEFAFITGHPRNATIIAQNDLTVYKLDRPVLEEILNSDPHALEHFNHIYQKRVHELAEKISMIKGELLSLAEQGY